MKDLYARLILWLIAPAIKLYFTRPAVAKEPLPSLEPLLEKPEPDAKKILLEAIAVFGARMNTISAELKQLTKPKHDLEPRSDLISEAEIDAIIDRDFWSKRLTDPQLPRTRSKGALEIAREASEAGRKAASRPR